MLWNREDKHDDSRKVAEDTNDKMRLDVDVLWNRDEEHDDNRDVAEDTNDLGALFPLAASPKPFPGTYAAAAAATSPTKYTSEMPVSSKCPGAKRKSPLPLVVDERV